MAIGRDEEDTGLVGTLLDELAKRIERAPLMRRSPGACSPDEQGALVGLLTSLQEVRATRASLRTTGDISLALAQETWPELGGLLVPSPPDARRGGKPRAKKEDLSPETLGAESADAGAPLFSQHAAEPAVETDVPAARELKTALVTIMRTNARPWSGARLAAEIQGKTPSVTGQQVYDILYRHSDLFTKTSRGWELQAR